MRKFNIHNLNRILNLNGFKKKLLGKSSKIYKNFNWFFTEIFFNGTFSKKKNFPFIQIKISKKVSYSEESNMDRAKIGLILTVVMMIRKTEIFKDVIVNFSVFPSILSCDVHIWVRLVLPNLKLNRFPLHFPELFHFLRKTKIVYRHPKYNSKTNYFKYYVKKNARVYLMKIFHFGEAKKRRKIIK